MPTLRHAARQAVSTTMGEGQVFSFPSLVSTRYLRMTIDTADQGVNRQYAFNEFAVIRSIAPPLIPEPTSLGLLALGLAALARRRRRK